MTLICVNINFWIEFFVEVDAKFGSRVDVDIWYNWRLHRIIWNSTTIRVKNWQISGVDVCFKEKNTFQGWCWKNKSNEVTELEPVIFMLNLTRTGTKCRE